MKETDDAAAETSCFASVSRFHISVVAASLNTEQKFKPAVGHIGFRSASPSCCCSVNRLMGFSPAVYSPYNRGEVCSNLGLDESFVEGSVGPRDHQGGEQVQGKVLEGVGDAVQMPEQTEASDSDEGIRKRLQW